MANRRNSHVAVKTSPSHFGIKYSLNRHNFFPVFLCYLDESLWTYRNKNRGWRGSTIDCWWVLVPFNTLWTAVFNFQTLTLVRSTPVRALTDTGSSANRRVTSPVTRLPSPLRMTISLVLDRGAATLLAIWQNTVNRVRLASPHH